MSIRGVYNRLILKLLVSSRATFGTVGGRPVKQEYNV